MKGFVQLFEVLSGETRPEIISKGRGFWRFKAGDMEYEFSYGGDDENTWVSIKPVRGVWDRILHPLKGTYSRTNKHNAVEVFKAATYFCRHLLYTAVETLSLCPADEKLEKFYIAIAKRVCDKEGWNYTIATARNDRGTHNITIWGF